MYVEKLKIIMAVNNREKTRKMTKHV